MAFYGDFDLLDVIFSRDQKVPYYHDKISHGAVGIFVRREPNRLSSLNKRVDCRIKDEPFFFSL